MGNSSNGGGSCLWRLNAKWNQPCLSIGTCVYSQVFPHPSLGGEDVDGILYLRVGYHEVGVHMYRASG